MSEWSQFYAVTGGMAATLTGLIFVAVSINLGRILEHALLPLRALEGLISLVAILFVSLIALIPEQTRFGAGLEIALVAVLLWSFQIWALASTHDEAKHFPRYWVRCVCCLLPAPPLIIGGLVIAIGQQASAAPWLLAGTLLTISAALTSAWVLLIEIKR